tara:strand:- start:416 stop:808 length:393 start_codon:yes stop_codon:yes gene_type:complete
VTPAEISASPPDISAIITSLGVFSLAVAAVVGGIYKGIKEVKKGGSETGSEVKGAVLVETLTLRDLSDSNRLLSETNLEIRDLLRQLCRTGDNVVEALKDHREITRSQIEEQHRLRAATVDLVEQMRRRT